MSAADVTSFVDRLRAAAHKWPGRIDEQELRLLRGKVIAMAPSDQFEALIAVFRDPPAAPYIAQQYAGLLLLDVSPPCPEPLDHLLRTVIPQWNLSVEQLPDYVAAAFQRDTVLTTLDRAGADDPINELAYNAFRRWFLRRRDAP